MGGPLRGCNRPVPDPEPPPPSATPATPAGPVDFALAPALRLRLLGSGLVAIGLVVALGVLVTWATDLPTAFVSGLIVLGAIGAVALGLLVGVRHWVLRLDDTGYRVRVLRTAGGPVGPVDRRARPPDRDRVRHQLSGAAPAARRAYGVLPVDAIEGDPVALTEALTTHLDRGHGYRRLR